MKRECLSRSFCGAILCEFGDGGAQLIQSRAGARAHEYAGNPTILISLDSRRELSSLSHNVDLVPDQDARRFPGRDLGQHLVDRLGLLVAYCRRSVHYVQQQVGHTDPTLTLRIYQQLLKRKRREEYRARVNDLLGTSPAALSRLPGPAQETALGPKSGPNSLLAVP